MPPPLGSPWCNSRAVRSRSTLFRHLRLRALARAASLVLILIDVARSHRWSTRTYALVDAPEAVRYLEERHAAGKVIVQV